MPAQPVHGMTSSAGNTLGQFSSAEPAPCAECGAQISGSQQADACELCGAPRCQQCAATQGHMGNYICPDCAAEAKDGGLM